MVSSIVPSPDRADVVDKAFNHIVITVGLTAVEVKVGASKQTGRQITIIYNNSQVETIFWGNSSVIAGTAVAGNARGFPIAPGQFVILPYGLTSVYLIANVAGVLATVGEVS